MLCLMQLVRSNLCGATCAVQPVRCNHLDDLLVSKKEILTNLVHSIEIILNELIFKLLSLSIVEI